MPVYQYACTECDEQLEVRQSFTDDALTVCPACEGRLRKVLNAVGVVFKGSGFYRTDSRAAASNGASSGTSKGSPDTADSGKGAPSTNGASKESSTKESGSKDAGSAPKERSGKGSGDGKPKGSGSASGSTSGSQSTVGAR